MNINLFYKILSSQIPDHASFALWDTENITNTSIIEENIPRLKTDTIIVGLNKSGGKNFDRDKKFHNYHSSYPGCKDKYLRAGFQEASKAFIGAYMTDLVKDNESVSQRRVTISEINFNEFFGELEFIEFFFNPHPLIICLGEKVHSEILQKHHLLGENILITEISHHASRGLSKEQFIKEIKNLEKKLRSTR